MPTSTERPSSEGYQPIEDYAIIGDLSTAALVGNNASIDFLCFPKFDSPSIFCANADWKKGGRFQIEPLLPDAFFQPEALEKLPLAASEVENPFSTLDERNDAVVEGAVSRACQAPVGVYERLPLFQGRSPIESRSR